MFALILEIIIAAIVSFFAYQWKWWIATLTFPIIMSLSNQVSKKFLMPHTMYREIIDSILIVAHIGYVISQVIIFQINIGSWYGWLIGLIVGWLLIGFMAPRRWAHEARNEA